MLLLIATRPGSSFLVVVMQAEALVLVRNLDSGHFEHAHQLTFAGGNRYCSTGDRTSTLNSKGGGGSGGSGGFAVAGNINGLTFRPHKLPRLSLDMGVYEAGAVQQQQKAAIGGDGGLCGVGGAAGDDKVTDLMPTPSSFVRYIDIKWGGRRRSSDGRRGSSSSSSSLPEDLCNGIGTDEESRSEDGQAQLEGPEVGAASTFLVKNLDSGEYQLIDDVCRDYTEIAGTSSSSKRP